MANPGANNTTPPVFNLPFGIVRTDGTVYLTTPALQFLTTLWDSIAGSGGGSDAGALIVGDPDYRETSPAPVMWTPTIEGGTTAGAQDYALQWGVLCVVGPMVTAMFNVVLSALDGATAGPVQIGGLPEAAMLGGGEPQGGFLSSFQDATLGASFTQLGLQIAPGATAFQVLGSGSAMLSEPLDATALAATSGFVGCCTYFR